jgi:hypothetical protein
MSRYTWGSATSFVSGKITAAYLDDVTVFVGNGLGENSNNHRGYVGEPSELNPELWKLSGYWWTSTDYPIYYRPPSDMTAGFYNLSLSVQDVEEVGWGSGIARTFPEGLPLTSDYGYDYDHKYLYDSSLSGRAYSLCLFPAIAKVAPSSGSVAGGTVLTISGSGFSTYNPATKDSINKNQVFASGQPCSVLSATVNTITCVTSSVQNSSLAAYIDLYNRENARPSVTEWKYNSTRSFGSPGWWINVWDWSSYSSNKFPLSDVRISFGLKQALSFGFYYDVGSNWPTLLSYSSKGSNKYHYAADFTTVLIAPYSGNYVFYMDSDDDAILFGSRYLYDTSFRNDGIGNEVQLLSTRYSPRGSFFKSLDGSLHLERGDKYHLRVRLSNGGGGPDFVELAMRVDLDDHETSTNNSISKVTMHHHSLKDIQIIQLSWNYQYEVQVYLNCLIYFLYYEQFSYRQ